jgi:hypothetical protein
MRSGVFKGGGAIMRDPLRNGIAEREVYKLWQKAAKQCARRDGPWRQSVGRGVAAHRPNNQGANGARANRRGARFFLEETSKLGPFGRIFSLGDGAGSRTGGRRRRL